jgi:hypothetical protein
MIPPPKGRDENVRKLLIRGPELVTAAKSAFGYLGPGTIRREKLADRLPPQTPFYPVMLTQMKLGVFDLSA